MIQLLIQRNLCKFLIKDANGKPDNTTPVGGGTAPGYATGNVTLDDTGNPQKSITDLISDATNNVNTAENNYRLILSGVTNLSNIDTLAQVQKTNTEAAISALEDIDVQEEMINLMQAQILEELSSEALIKIKESSKYIVNLIRA